jgi:ketosteroid isomerase-like protein
MEDQGNVQTLAEDVFKAMNQRDFNAFEQLITEDVAFDFPGAGRVEGKRRTLLLLKSILRKYPVLRLKVSKIIVSGDRACTVWTNRGEASDGTPYSNSGMTLLHIKDGKVRFISDYFKDTSFAR